MLLVRLVGRAIALLSCVSFAQDINGQSDKCSCFTHTTTGTPVSSCSPLATCPPVPLCLALTTTTIPGPNVHCPTTPTVTVAGACKTACPTGRCGGATSTLTVTASSACLKSTCYTYTSIPQPTLCPDFASSTRCIRPACIMLSTTTLPPVDPVCPTTSVVVATPSCLNYCPGGCETTLTTVREGEVVGITTPIAPAPQPTSTTIWFRNG